MIALLVQIGIGAGFEKKIVDVRSVPPPIIPVIKNTTHAIIAGMISEVAAFIAVEY